MNRAIFIWLPAVFAGGCAHLETPPPAPAACVHSEKLELRNNAASLFYDLLGDEKNVAKVLLVKGHGQDLRALIKSISAIARQSQKELDELPRGDPTLNLHALNLPPGEQAARAAEAKTTEHALLFSSGKNFEFNLLLTQAEALNYGWHLAKVAADNSSQPDEIEHFTAMSRLMADLYRQVIQAMRAEE